MDKIDIYEFLLNKDVIELNRVGIYSNDNTAIIFLNTLDLNYMVDIC